MSDDQPIPAALRIAWGVADGPRRGPARELTHEQIVQAAIAIADEHGLAGVTMQRVAASLGRTTMALYRYVDSKDDLLQLMQDHAVQAALEGWSIDETLSWAEALRRFATGVRDIYRQSPWLLDIPLSMTGILMPHNLKVADAAFGAMRNLALTDSEKIAILLNLSLHARMFAGLERDLLATSAAVFNPETIELVKSAVTPAGYPHAAAAVASGALLGIDETAEEPAAGENDADDPAGIGRDWQRGLDLLLAGIAASTHPTP